jgi:hypothetical protein
VAKWLPESTQHVIFRSSAPKNRIPDRGIPVATHAAVTEDESERSPSGDWSTTYSQFLSRATAQAAATLSLYQQALLRVSEGKLEPTAFQNYLPTFAQTCGPAYAARLSELAAGFLTRLVAISAASSRNAGESGSAGFSDPEPAPPRFETSNPAIWFEQLADYAGRINSRALRAYRAQLDQVAAGEKSPAEIQQQSIDALSRKVPQLLQQMTDLYFDLLGGLNEIRADYEKEYFLGVLGLAGRPDREAPLVVQLTAPRGEVASASLTVANTTGARSTIRFSYTDARRTDGAGPAFTPELQIAPASLELDPEQEEKVSLRLRLSESRFDEGAPCACTLYIIGGDVQRVEVQLRITATAGTHAAAASDHAG